MTTYRVLHTHGITETFDSFNDTLLALKSVYGKHVVLDGGGDDLGPWKVTQDDDCAAPVVALVREVEAVKENTMTTIESAAERLGLSTELSAARTELTRLLAIEHVALYAWLDGLPGATEEAAEKAWDDSMVARRAERDLIVRIQNQVAAVSQ